MGICPYCELDESVCDRSLGWPQRARCWESAWNLRGIELSATRSKLVLSNHEATALRAENARLREALTAITDEFEATVRHCDNDGKGMQVPFHGDFAGAKQMPSIANRIRWWARFLRAALDAKEGE